MIKVENQRYIEFDWSRTKLFEFIVFGSNSLILAKI